MDITGKKNRSVLKSYFVKNSIPTESNFVDLIDGMLNQNEDGIFKASPNDPLCISAVGDSNGLRKVLTIFDDFKTFPHWSLLLNPSQDGNEATATKAKGLCLAYAPSNTPCLFIDLESMKLGVRTIKPVAPLDIAQFPRTDSHPDSLNGMYVTGNFGEDNNGVEFRHTNGAEGIGFGYNTVYAAGSNPNQDLKIRAKGTGKVRILGDLEVSGGVTEFSPDRSFTIRLSGGSFALSGSSSDRLKWTSLAISSVDVAEFSANPARGLNCIILTANGVPKTKDQAVLVKVFDVYAGAAQSWNDWAAWVSANAQTGDIVAVASYDAISNPPESGVAAEFLKSINALRIFNAVSSTATEQHRVPFALLFVVGKNAVETVSAAGGNAAIISTTYQQLLQDDWVRVDLKSSWVNYGYLFNPAQYRKDKGGVVWLRGLISGGTTPNQNSNGYPILFNLPEPFRPAHRELRPIIVAEKEMGRVDIDPSGDVILIQASNNVWLSLDGIAFHAANFSRS